MDALAEQARQRARHWQLVYALVSLLIGGGLIVRLYGWQVLQHQQMVRRASHEHVSQELIPARRGTIYDAHGEALVTNVDYHLVFAVPSQLDRPEIAAEKLAPILGMPSGAIMQRFAASKYWVSLAHMQPPAVANQIRALKLAGIGLQPESKRVYPAGSLASQLLGFTSYDGQGQYGIERYYNKQLSGTPGRLTAEHDVAGNLINLNDSSMNPPQNGADLSLTIDRTIQFIAEQQLDAAVAKHQATGGTVIVMDPHTGAILAMASTPTYDPNHFETTKSKLFVNPAISVPYEPGSTFKVVTLSTGLDLHRITPNTTMVDTGSAILGGQRIWDWDRKAHGTVTMTQVLEHSLNLGAAFVARRTGPADFYRYVHNFGFGARTGIDLQGEVVGTVRQPDGGNWYPIDLSTNAFGQGLTVTPIQLITAVAAVANGGAMVRPYVVAQIVRNGHAQVTVPTIVGHPISPETAQQMTTMMEAVVAKGEGTEAAIPGYIVAGKTGTASIAEHGVYLQNATIASFIGFVPAQQPAFIMLVKIDRPKDDPWGADVAAPVFASISKELLMYLHVAPTEPLPTPTAGPTATATAAMSHGSQPKAAETPAPITRPAVVAPLPSTRQAGVTRAPVTRPAASRYPRPSPRAVATVTRRYVVPTPRPTASTRSRG